MRKNNKYWPLLIGVSLASACSSSRPEFGRDVIRDAGDTKGAAIGEASYDASESGISSSESGARSESQSSASVETPLTSEDMTTDNGVIDSGSVATTNLGAGGSSTGGVEDAADAGVPRDSGISGDETNPPDASSLDGGTSTSGNSREAGSGPCTPFTANDGCAVGQWCTRVLIGEGSECIPHGAQAIGESCETDSDCDRGLYCYLDAECRPVCDAEADPEAPGGSGLGNVCERRVQMGSIPLNVGNCRETCEYGSDSCSVAGESCLIEELNPTGEDVCEAYIPEVAPVGEPCEVPPEASPGSISGGKHICLETTAGSQECFELCRASEGTLGTSEHVDCTGAGRPACLDAFGQDASVGVCVSNL